MKISEVKFGSLLTYTPRSNLQKHKESQSVMHNLKHDNVLVSGILTSEYYAQIINKKIKQLQFGNYFNSNTILIPTPKSSLLQKDELWVPQRITKALINNKLGKSSEECLERIIALPKSSTSTPQNRSKAIQHYNSIKVKKLLFEPKEIILVDDVVTRGATILGAVNKLAETFPNTKIRAFAVMRTISDPSKFSNIYDPCVGTIKLKNGETFRSP